VSFPDLIENVDTLAAMRGTLNLLADMIENKEFCHSMLKQLVDMYFVYYDQIYNIIKDEEGGSVYWVYAPGRIAKLQCDYSAMISKDMFEEYVVQYLNQIHERLDYSFYHFDGPQAIHHLDSLLNMPKLGGIQWTPGAAFPNTDNERWLPMYKKIVDAGKKIFIFGIDPKNYKKIINYIGTNNVFMSMWLQTEKEVEEFMNSIKYDL